MTNLDVVFVDTSKAVINIETKSMIEALKSMGVDIQNHAKLYAPYDSGNLVHSMKAKVENQTLSVSFGGQSSGSPKPVEYARRRHYENKKHPSTLRYLERAGDVCVERGLEYYQK